MKADRSGELLLR